MAARRAASPLPTVKLPHSRDKPTGRAQRENGRLGLVEAQQEASELPPLVTLLPTGVPAVVAPPQRAKGLLLLVTLLPTGVPAVVAPPQQVSEPRLPVRPQLADLPAAEARVPSEGAPGDTTDPALAPPAAAVPPAWDHAAVVVVVGADERASAGFYLPAPSERLEAGS
jgi:hypothetical protein